MSLYAWEEDIQGIRCEVNIGWDPVLKRYFMFIQNLETDEDIPECMLFDTLRMGVNLPLETLIEILKGMGITISKEISESLIEDGSPENAGLFNYQVPTH